MSAPGGERKLHGAAVACTVSRAWLRDEEEGKDLQHRQKCIHKGKSCRSGGSVSTEQQKMISGCKSSDTPPTRGAAWECGKARPRDF